MNKIKYTLTPYGAYLTEVDKSNSDNLTFLLDGEDEAILKIGDSTYKISHGVCLITPSEIADGIYIPELIYDGGAVPLDTVEVRYGVICIRPGVDELVKIQGELLALSERTHALEESNRRLHDAVFGTKLF